MSKEKHIQEVKETLKDMNQDQIVDWIVSLEDEVDEVNSMYTQLCIIIDDIKGIINNVNP